MIRYVVKKDPKPRQRQGVPICAVCPIELPEVSIKNGDVFCSTQCCHEYHEVEVLQPGKGYTVGSSS